MVNKHQAMWEYIRRYPELDRFLYFNTIQEFANETGFNPIYSQTDIKRYTSGETMRQYDFAIVQMLANDIGGTSDINTTAMFDVQRFMDWITEQNRVNHYPDFGEYCNVQRIENLQNMPSLAGISETGIAKYMFQCRVTYLEINL